MAAVLLEFFVPRSVLAQVRPPSPACPFGEFHTYFDPVGLAPSACFEAITAPDGSFAVTNLLAAARASHMQVHLGLAYAEHIYNDTDAGFAAFSTFQQQLVRHLWGLYKDYGTGTDPVWVGIYTDIEVLVAR